MEKKTKTVAYAGPKKTADEIAFDKFMAKYDANLAKRCGRVKLLNIYLAGIKRGKATK